VAGRKKSKLQIAQALGFGQRCVAALCDCFAHFGPDRRLMNARRHFAGRGRRQHHAAHEVWTVGGQHLRDEVAVGVAHDDRGAHAFVLDYCSDVGGEVVQRLVRHRAGARADAAGLGPQDAEAVLDEQPGDDVVVFGTATERRQDHDDRASSLRNHFDVCVAAVHNEPLPLCP